MVLLTCHLRCLNCRAPGSSPLIVLPASACGPCRAIEAAMAAIDSPLLEVGIDQATGVVWNITGPKNITMSEVGEGGPPSCWRRLAACACADACMSPVV